MGLKKAKNVLKKEPYGNIKVLSKDGTLMFLCDKKKADWYLSRNLADWTEENVIQLNFEAAGLGNAHKLSSYHLEHKENRCVVCGGDEELTRHHVVPYCYRRWFPDRLKTKDCHDVLPMCVKCHNKYEASAICIKNRLGEQYNCPTCVPITDKVKYTTQMSRAAHTLLLYNDRIPPDRQEFIKKRIEERLGHYPTENDLKELAAIDLGELSGRGLNSHGRKLVAQLENLEDFILMWRQHFLDEMQPQYLSNAWNVNYRLEDYRNAKESQ